MAKFKQIYSNDDGWSEWELPDMIKYKLGCCSCALVHDMEFSIVKATPQECGGFTTQEVKDGDLRVMFRAKVNNRSTAQLRRQDKTKQAKLK